MLLFNRESNLLYGPLFTVVANDDDAGCGNDDGDDNGDNADEDNDADDDDNE